MRRSFRNVKTHMAANALIAVLKTFKYLQLSQALMMMWRVMSMAVKDILR